MLTNAEKQNTWSPAQRTAEMTTESVANDRSTEAAAQRRRDALLSASPILRKVAQRSEGLEEEEPLQGKFDAVQRMAPDEEELPIQGKADLAQRMEPEEELPLQGKFDAVQRLAPEEEELPVQGKMDPVQRLAPDEEELPVQGRFAGVQRKVDPTTEVGGVAVNDDPSLEHEADVMGAKAAQFVPESVPVQGRFEGAAQLEEKPNQTGLPDNLKAGIENLSGMSMDGVKVHYNSDKPAQLNALAYAQGTDIHVGPGQEQHLPHEAWHVVQQGR